MNIRSNLRCSLEGEILWGAAAMLHGADSRTDRVKPKRASAPQFQFNLILNKVYLKGEVSRKLVVCFTDPFKTVANVVSSFGHTHRMT
jgi:hypothetical protein